MSKELLLKLAEDYSMLAEDLKKLAAGETVSAASEAPAESKKEEKAEVPFEVEEKKETPKQEKKPEKKYTMADVRKKLSSLSSGGKTAEVRELPVKHGANRLSEIKPEDYAVLMEEAENL